jgi:hypothetical protein
MIQNREKMFGKISKEETEEAIQYLMDHIPKDCLKKVYVTVQKKGYLGCM